MACTQSSVDCIHWYSYADIAYTHSCDSTANTTHRVNILSHVTSQEAEQAVSDPQYCAQHQHALHPSHTVHITQTSRFLPVPQGCLMRRVCMTLGTTLVWISPHCWMVACNYRLNVPDPPTVLGRSSHAISVWANVSPVLSLHPSGPPAHLLPSHITSWWFWFHDVDTHPQWSLQYSAVGQCRDFELYAPHQGWRAISETQHLRLHFLFHDMGTSNLQKKHWSSPKGTTSFMTSQCR